jgi:phosphoribosylpyrophosphate synthetase
MLVKGGFDHIITVDLHSKESLGFFDCAIDNVHTRNALSSLCHLQVSKFFDQNGVTQLDFSPKSLNIELSQTT